MTARKRTHRPRVAKAVAVTAANGPRLLLAFAALAAALLICCAHAFAHESPEQLAKGSADAAAEEAPISGQLPSEAKSVSHAGPAADEDKPSKVTSTVAAMDAKKGRSVHAGELISAGAENAVYIGRHNQRVELSPRTVVEFDDKGGLRLLRGSAVVESREEATVHTAGASVEFVGKALVSYDHAERSTSAFVLEGEARLGNAHRDDASVRLQRFRGATLVVGEILPQLVRQLDVAAVQGWLKGYSWPEERRRELLRDMPGEPQVAQTEVPGHLRQAKIEDYFSSIDTADELHQPDYYDKKFDDPDKVVAEQNSKQGGHKALSPEEAALISLPKTQIDLGFELGPEFLSAEQKAKEVARVEQPSVSKRAPASLPRAVKAAPKARTAAPAGDPDVNGVLERLRRVRSGNAEVSRTSTQSRVPSSVTEPVVPDPVYDYSQNF